MQAAVFIKTVAILLRTTAWMDVNHSKIMAQT